MTSRLDEIKNRNTHDRGEYCGRQTQTDFDIAWLISEVEDLQLRLANTVELREKFIAERDDFRSEVKRLEKLYLEMRDGHEHVVHKMSEELAEAESCAKGSADLVYDLGQKLGAVVFDNERLKSKLAIAVEALEFYGDFKRWQTVTVSNHNQRFCIMIGADLEYFQEPNQDSYCGKRARQALAKVKDGGE